MNRNKRLGTVVLIAVIVIFVIMGISFATLSSNTSPGSSLFGSVLRPVQSAFSYIGNSIGGFFGFVGDMRNMQEENVELREEIDRLSAKVRDMESHSQENERLRQLLELKSNQAEHTMVAGEVIAKDPGNWFYSFTIDVGTSSGVQKNDPVISGTGLVGHVIEVGSNWARVQAIIDSESSVGAMISRTQDFAIADGDMTLANSGKCKLSYVTQNSSLVLGDAVVTSGLGGVYPAGLLIGTVAEIKSDSLGYSQYAVIDTAVDFERVREVLVICMGR
ncbi:MAG: rod shape-determining protein MreC [Ruminococcaceae bacterium]|nr:rod shape-determining protein MreC [Oscillospiraceae bacterium]